MSTEAGRAKTEKTQSVNDRITRERERERDAMRFRGVRRKGRAVPTFADFEVVERVYSSRSKRFREPGGLFDAIDSHEPATDE